MPTKNYMRVCHCSLFNGTCPDRSLSALTIWPLLNSAWLKQGTRGGLPCMSCSRFLFPGTSKSNRNTPSNANGTCDYSMWPLQRNQAQDIAWQTTGPFEAAAMAKGNKKADPPSHSLTTKPKLVVTLLICDWKGNSFIFNTHTLH